METPGDEEDIEKRFCEADPQFDGEDQVDSAVIFAGNRSKAARQLQTVAKSFGSIGSFILYLTDFELFSSFREINV